MTCCRKKQEKGFASVYDRFSYQCYARFSIDNSSLWFVNNVICFERVAVLQEYACLRTCVGQRERKNRREIYSTLGQCAVEQMYWNAYHFLHQRTTAYRIIVVVVIRHIDEINFHVSNLRSCKFCDQCSINTYPSFRATILSFSNKESSKSLAIETRRFSISFTEHNNIDISF